MELSDRKKAILSEIVKLYIATGEPIGSKILCSILKNAPSGATLRNEMSALCEMGFLEQPHTSAGRVPTADGYKMYINSLMTRDTLSKEIKDHIDNVLDSAECDPEKMPQKAGELLTEITGLPSIAANITNNGVALKCIELLPMGRRACMLIIVLSDGRSRSRLCHLSSDLSPELISRFDKAVVEKVRGEDIVSLTPAFMQGLLASGGMDALSLMPLISTLFEMINEISGSNISLKGESNLFSMYETKSVADSILSLINKQSTLLPLMLSANKPVNVFFGDDMGYAALKPSSVILAKYRVNGKDIGCIGVVGPTRMSYEHIIPSVEYTASRVGDKLSDTLRFLED